MFLTVMMDYYTQPKKASWVKTKGEGVRVEEEDLVLLLLLSFFGCILRILPLFEFIVRKRLQTKRQKTPRKES